MRGNQGSGDEESTGGLDQIREILFGTIQRELERKLSLAEAHLVARANDLHQETRRRTEILEGHLKRESEALSTRLDHDVAETKELIKKAVGEFRGGLDAAEQRLLKLEESISRQQGELRHALLDQAKAFLDELQRVREEVVELVQRELGFAEGEAAGEAEERPAP